MNRKTQKYTRARGSRTAAASRTLGAAYLGTSTKRGSAEAEEVWGFAEPYSIAADLLTLRRLRRMTRARLGELSGISPGLITAIERGTAAVTDSMFFRLADVLDAEVRLVKRSTTGERPGGVGRRRRTAIKSK